MISSSERSALRELTELYGVKRSYKAMDDRRISASPEATLAVLEALGADARGGDPLAILKREEEALWQRPLEPVVVAWDGILPAVSLRLPAAAARRTLELTITLEDGGTLTGNIAPSQRKHVREKQIGRSKFVEAMFAVDDRLPHGYHELHIRAEGVDASCTIFAAPMQCYQSDQRRTWGVFAALCTAREPRQAGRRSGGSRRIAELGEQERRTHGRNPAHQRRFPYRAVRSESLLACIAFVLERAVHRPGPAACQLGLRACA
jgi:hypothetical protein